MGAVLVVAAVVLAACGGDDDGVVSGTSTTSGGSGTTVTTSGSGGATADRGNVDGTLQVGLLLPQTGDLAVVGPAMFEAAKMAISEINDAGGVLGEPVAFVEGDDGGGSNNDLASSTADRMLTTDRVDTILGAASSGTTKAIIDRVTSAGAVMCSPSNTAAELSTIDDNGGYYFRTAPPDNLQGPALADLMTGDGHERVSIIVRNDSYGVGFGDFLKEGLEANGATVVPSDPITYDPNGTAFDADVAQVVDAEPDAVALISFPDTGGLIIKTLIEQESGPGVVPLYVADGMQSNDLSEKVDPEDPSVVDGVKGTAPSAAPENGNPTFPERFAEFAPGVDTIFSAHAYDCMMVMALAAQAAGSDDPADIRGAMIDVTGGGEQCSSYGDCLALLESGEDIDYEGASGPLDFVEKPGGGGEPSAGTYDVYEFGADGTYSTTGDQVNVAG